MWRTHSERETEEFGGRLARELVPDGILLLSGDLGTGKTVLARGVAAELGIPGAEIQSPTFTVIREHQGAEHRLIHIDVYRLEAFEIEALGLEETLAGPGVKVVEWAEKLPFPVADCRRIVVRRGDSESERLIEENEG